MGGTASWFWQLRSATKMVGAKTGLFRAQLPATKTPGPLILMGAVHPPIYHSKHLWTDGHPNGSPKSIFDPSLRIAKRPHLVIENGTVWFR